MASRLTLRHVFRHYSTILSSNTSPPLTSKEKTRTVLLLIKSETNPERILDICRAFSLTPESHQYRAVLSVAVTKLTAANHFYCIRKFFDELFQTRPDLNNERFISHVILLYGHANMFPHALRTFNHMRDEHHINPSVKSLNALLLASIIAKDYKEGMITRGRKPNSESYDHLIYGFCKEGNLEEAKRLFAEMRKRGYKVDSGCYFTMVHFLCEGGEFESSFEIANKESIAKALFPSFTVMKKLVNGLVGVSKIDDVKELIKEIKENFAESSDKWDKVEAGLPHNEE